MESENMAGAAQTSLEQTTDDAQGIEFLGELLAEQTSLEDDAGALQDDTGATAKPVKFNDLAGKLGMDLDDLYKLEIAQAEDGTPLTIEHLKDNHSKQADYSLREIEFEERRTTQEAAMMQAQEEIRELMAAMPEKAIRPEVLQKVRDKHDAQLSLERKRTLEVIPDWQDVERRTADIEGMSEHMKQYGYPVDYLQRVADHRQIKYIRDNWQREQRIRIAISKVKAGKPNPTSRQKPAAKAPSKAPLAGVNQGNSRNKLEAVFSELD